MVCLDLEDAVAASRKAEARDTTVKVPPARAGSDACRATCREDAWLVCRWLGT